MNARWLLLGWVLIAPVARAEKGPENPPSLVLTAQENGTVPQTEFSCYGKIHGYLRLPGRTHGTHRLKAVWTRPKGKVAADSQTEVDFSPPGRSTAYVWFSFPEPPRMGAIDPKGDEERLTYPGVWTVHVSWDDKPLITSTFSVRCP